MLMFQQKIKSLKLIMGLGFIASVGVFTPNTAYALPNYQLPDALNYEKLNQPRTCSPAEIYSGKTSCSVCDEDVPNIVSQYPSKNNVRGIPIYGNDEYQKYNGTYEEHPFANKVNNNTVTRKPAIGGGQNTDNLYYLYSGYNLKGLSEHFSGGPFRFNSKGVKFDGLNKRTMCKSLKPNPNYKADPSKSPLQNALRGAAIGGAIGVISGSDLINVFGNPNGNKGKGKPLGNGSGGSGAGKNSMIGTEAFACLEYYTGTNTSQKGGDHLKGNPNASTKCDNPMDQYYNNYVSEIKVYNYPIDGIDNSCFAPGTKILRYVWLMANNPYFMYGKTPTESLTIALTRPGTKEMSVIETSQNCKPQMQ